ncbi:MAG: hypothetical protein RIQ81_2394 [Pseudomonadota bacterium]
MVTSNHIQILDQIEWLVSVKHPSRLLKTEFGFATGTDADALLARSCHALQVHGANLVDGQAANPKAQNRPEADGLYTTLRGETVAVKTADCLPILMRGESPDGERAIALAVHAGWRGFCAGIISNAVSMTRRTGITAETLNIIIGPAICSRHFEIGPEVLDAIHQHRPRDAGFFVQKGKGDRWHADLQTGAALELTELGVKPSRITVVRQCTHEDASIPSYRRDGKGCGRLVSWIKL